MTPLIVFAACAALSGAGALPPEATPSGVDRARPSQQSDVEVRQVDKPSPGVIVVPDQSVRARIAQRMAGSGNGPLVVHTPGAPLVIGGDVQVSRDSAPASNGLIEVPSNTLGDEPRAEVWSDEPADELSSYDTGEYESTERHYHLAWFGADPYEHFGYTQLKVPRRQSCTVRRIPLDRPRSPRSHDIDGGGYRRAQLQFAEAASPKLDGLDDGYRRAQLHFAEAAAPDLRDFGGASRRAQLQFHESTVSSSPDRGSAAPRREPVRPRPRPDRGVRGR